MKKKGSLSLSINAIVILVLAITMLGLGLGFTKGMFGKLSEKLTVPEPDIPATADETIVLPTTELTITKNKQFVFSVNAYNDDFTMGVMGRLHCDADADSGAGEINVCSGPQDIAPAEDKGFKFIIPKDKVKFSSTRICGLQFFDADGYTTAQCGSEPPADVTKETKQVVVTIK
ncbi:hypothetical protein HQ545_05220 [Candidatus Woesearchaeota archaeon]|nr:hypothetical protein [Candidatus Woesearchaeota archaeon]